MADNIVKEHGDQLYVTVTHPTTPSSGDPVRWGDRCGVALTDEQDDGKTTVKFNGTATLTVEAEGGAISEGDELFYDDGDTGINNSSSGNTHFGWAMEAIDNAATASIEVKIGY